MVGVLAYAAAAQAGGWVLGPAFGYRPFSFHIAGTLVGCTPPPQPGEIVLWATYNFIIFAVLPYLWFRRRYTPLQLGLKSVNLGNDTLVIVVIGVVESVSELATLNHDILKLNRTNSSSAEARSSWPTSSTANMLRRVQT